MRFRFPEGWGRGGKRIKTPLVMQTHATECGAACLGSVLGYFGRWVPFAALREACEVSRDGSSAGSLARVAKRYGLGCTGYRLTGAQVKSLRLPLIVFWEFRHFVVVEGWRSGWFYLNDPGVGRYKITEEAFFAGFAGIALEFEPETGFEPGGDRPNLARHWPAWFNGNWGTLALALTCSLLLAVLMLVPAATLGVFTDRVLGENLPWRNTLVGLLLAAAVLAYGVGWLKALWLQRLVLRLSVTAGNRCLAHFLRLPMDYLRYRVDGDLVTRLGSTDEIARSLISHVVGVSLEVAMGVVFLAAMFALQPELALLVLLLGVLNFAFLRIAMHWRDDYSRVWHSDRGKLAGAGTMMMEQVGLLRSTGAEDSTFGRWSAYQAQEVSSRQQFVEFSHFNTALSVLFVGLSTAVVLGYGATEVMAGHLTTGGLLSFLIVAGLFLQPVSRFAEFADHAQELEVNLHRLDDILQAQTDPAFPSGNGTAESADPDGLTDHIVTLDGRLRLTGRVELRDITFGYHTGKEPLLENFNLTVKPGQRVALVGPSGSGKSTLAYLVAGLYRPFSGEILFDGRPRDEVPFEILTRSLSMVDQNFVLFSGTVRDNITLWSPAVPDRDLTSAARDAHIHEELVRRPLGYESRVEEDGRNFSGGQCQRIEIARALVSNPTILVLDEATSALDAATEESIDRALRRRGCTCLIIAHRLSTIRDCDEIVVMDKGRVSQRGTHQELIADLDGLYYRLVHAG